MDSKRSRVTEASRKQYRRVLPRQTDLLTDVLGLQAGCFTAESVDIFVQDAEDAYCQVPLNPRECKFYCCILRMPDGRTRYLVYLVTAQGSRGGPLSWSVVFWSGRTLRSLGVARSCDSGSHTDAVLRG